MSQVQYMALRAANRQRYAYIPPPPPSPEENPDAVSMDDMSLADAYAQLAIAIRRGNAAQAAELQDHINSTLQRAQANSGSTADVETENIPGEGGTDWRR